MPTGTLHPLPYQPDPAAYFARLRQAPGAILLDSARPGAERGRFDLLSAWPLQQLQAEPAEDGRAFLARLREGLARLGSADLPSGVELPFAGGLIGYLSYDFGRRLAARTPEFQTEQGYEKSAPGKANLTMSTNQLAERYGAVAMTLEMPFKDHDPNPDAEFGWSPERSRKLAAAMLETVEEVIDGI